MLAHLLMTLLGYHGHAMLEARDGAEGLALTLSERPDLVSTRPTLSPPNVGDM